MRALNNMQELRWRQGTSGCSGCEEREMGAGISNFVGQAFSICRHTPPEMEGRPETRREAALLLRHTVERELVKIMCKVYFSCGIHCMLPNPATKRGCSSSMLSHEYAMSITYVSLTEAHANFFSPPDRCSAPPSNIVWSF